MIGAIKNLIEVVGLLSSILYLGIVFLAFALTFFLVLFESSKDLAAGN